MPSGPFEVTPERFPAVQQFLIIFSMIDCSTVANFPLIFTTRGVVVSSKCYQAKSSHRCQWRHPGNVFLKTAGRLRSIWRWHWMSKLTKGPNHEKISTFPNSLLSLSDPAQTILESAGFLHVGLHEPIVSANQHPSLESMQRAWFLELTKGQKNGCVPGDPKCTKLPKRLWTNEQTDCDHLSYVGFRYISTYLCKSSLAPVGYLWKKFEKCLV
jgi:hypothetical protein